MKWIQSEIATGFQKLVALRLRNAPPEEVIVGTVAVWLEALMDMPINWDEQQDRSRLTEAFKVLCRTSTNWPTIKEFIDVLPARPPPVMLPMPKTDPEIARKNIAAIKAMLRNKPIFKRI